MADAVHLLQGGSARYDSPHIYSELLQSISTVLEAQLRADLSASPFVGIGVDESTDRGSEKHLAVVIRYVAKGSVMKTGFLTRVKVT